MGDFADLGGGLGGAAGGLAVLLGAGGKGGRWDYERAVNVMEDLKAANYDYRAIPWEDLRLVGEYFPEVYTAVVPEEARMAQDSPEARNAQVRSLGKLEEIRDKGLTPLDRLQAQEAGRYVSGEIEAGSKNIRRDLAQRVRLSGGLELVSRAQADQNAMEMANRLGSDLARNAMQRQLQATTAAGQMGGQLRGADIGFSAMNADIANRFNEMRTGRQNEAAQWAAMTRNQAQQQNLGERQRISDTNVLGRTQTKQRNQEYANAMRSQAYDDAYRRAAGIAGGLEVLGRQKDLARARKEEQIIGLGEGAGKSIGAGGDIFMKLYGGGGMGGWGR